MKRFGVVAGLLTALFVCAVLLVVRQNTWRLRISSPGTDSVTVRVSGAVEQPGIYSLPAGSRVQQAIELAGGPRPDAQIDAVDSDSLLDDTQELFVPSSLSFDTLSRVNLNTASAQELETLPGIGPMLAQAIVSDREQQGVFSAPEDIMRVDGIGTGIYEKIKDQITVG